MDPIDFTSIIRAAEGYAFLGLCDEAWDLVKTLPPENQHCPRAFAVRLIICTHLKKWETGMELALEFDTNSHIGAREVAGRFYLAYAAVLAGDNRLTEADTVVSLMKLVWPEGNTEALRSRALRRLWRQNAPVEEKPLPEGVNLTGRADWS